MHTRTRLAIIFVLGATVGVLANTLGCHPHHGQRPDPEKARKFLTFVVEDALDDLQADASQRDAVLAAKDRIFDEAARNHEEAEASHRALLGEWKKASPDGEKVHALIDANIERLRAMAHLVADEALATHAILTPEQRAAVAAHIEARRPPAGR